MSMIRSSEEIRAQLVRRALLGGIAFAMSLIVGIQIAHSAEIVPSVGLTRSEGASETKPFGSLAFRGNLLPIVQTEIGVAYRSESRFDDMLDVRMWPVTASLWLNPFPALYAGGGVGWYHTTLDYESETGLEDETTEEFGVHLGGGLKVPLAPAVGLDLHGRYVMMRDQDARLIPERFDPDFWETKLGIAFKF